MNDEVREPDRNTSLDGLRAIAVFCVLLHHWTGWGIQFGLGQIGVQTFFVISGFLITRILLRSRARAESFNSAMLPSIRLFYIRRTLRIFPIYYLLLGAIFVSDRFGIAETVGWHALYISNVYFFKQGMFEGPLSHLWTLSVEEQFYLFWPWLVLWAPRRLLPFIISSLIVLAPTVRILLYTTGHSAFAQYNTLVCSNFDSLGCGALLGWSHICASAHQRDLVIKALRIGAPIGIMSIAISFFVGDRTFFVASDQLMFAVVVTGLLQYIQTTAGRHILGFLSVSPLVYLGRISYGIYLYHMFAPNFMNLLRVPENLQQGTIGFMVMLVITLLVASVSWFAIERPINSIKMRFAYFQARAVPATL